MKHWKLLYPEASHQNLNLVRSRACLVFRALSLPWPQLFKRWSCDPSLSSCISAIARRIAKKSYLDQMT